MKQRLIMFLEVIGGIIACVGVGMYSIEVALITAGTLIVVACEANS
jgi:hypothetical protein